MSEGPALIHLEGQFIQAFRDISNSTNERTAITSVLSRCGIGNNSPLIEYPPDIRALGAALILANMSSLPFDWAARLSVGGTHMNFFIVKQLPVLSPQRYIDKSSAGQTYVESILPRVLELIFTSWELEGFARDLGYDGPPFRWDEDRRHRLKSELDAIYAHMYRLDRSDLEWILDAEPPSASFPTLKKNELKRFGEYRTQRYVLQAFDQLQRGENPDLS